MKKMLSQDVAEKRETLFRSDSRAARCSEGGSLFRGRSHG